MPRKRTTSTPAVPAAARPSPEPTAEAQAGLPFPIVGIGASAGGLEAITQLLKALPADTGMAFLVVQHLDPLHESRLPELLARATEMPVAEAVHGQAVDRNHVYVIPPSANLTLARGLLQLKPRSPGRIPNLPVDLLLRSLADDQVGRAVAVILSGTGSDGTQGLCEVKAVGGITFAQSEPSAVHSGMPRSAIDSGCVDFVLPPDQIARRLADIGAHPYLAPDPGPVDTGVSAEREYRRILNAVRSGTGVDFSHYRDTTVRRRIGRRMALHTQDSLALYAERLDGDPSEVDALYNDLLINVTSFFRDPEMFEAIKRSVFPEITQDKSAVRPVRVWVPGCSTGQEAYSLAMALIEFYADQPVRPAIQIFATDLSDQTALHKARAGIYPEAIEAEVSPERLRRFFRREDHGYRIDRSIREMCVFARHNVATDPPFSHIDLISCRNLLIYLTPPLQKRILAIFHYALNPGGALVLGSAETVGDQIELFELRDRGHRIYFRKQALARQPVFATSLKDGLAARMSQRSVPGTPLSRDYQKEADRVLLTRFAPPGVLVDENFEILQFRGQTGPYLETPPGEPTTNLLKMAREGLLLELRNALAEARKRRTGVRRDGVRVRDDSGSREVALEVIPVAAPETGPCYLVLFQEPAGARAAGPKPAKPRRSQASADREATGLRQELAATREYLQSMVEQQDAVNEELRSANEEILSSNEELQSTNEELETAKEELQSSNEELTTVNEQVNRRNTELDQANSDLTNLLASANLPVVMVGGDLRIRRVTPAAGKALGLINGDVGRPIGDLKPAILVPDLEGIISGVIRSGQPVEREVRDREGRWFMLRVLPYQTSANLIDGAVLVFVDIHQVRQDQEDLRRQAMLIELSQDAIVIRDAGNRVIFWNRGAEAMYDWPAAAVRGKVLGPLLGTDSSSWTELNERLDRTGQWEGQLSQRRRDGTVVIVHSREVLVRDERGSRLAVLAIKRDITEARRMVSALREADRRKDEFLATLAHELRNPLAPIRNAVEIIRLAEGDPAALAPVHDILERQVRQLAHIVEDLIDLTRIAEKKIQIRTEPTELSRVVETALETCRSMIESSGQRLTVQLPVEPLLLEADPVRLSQVVINLLDNASKYTDPGGEIWLKAEKHPADLSHDGGLLGRDHVVITVRDSGMGIPPDLLPHIFELFTQGARGRLHGRAGLGVGLTLVRSLVQLHGGQVEARSDGPGLGSEFQVSLPLESEGAPAGSGGTPASESPRVPKRILVVEDNRDQLESLGMLLGLMGHDVRLAGDGTEALETVRSFEPEVVLVDIGLPGMNGYELARRLREEPRLRDVLLVAQSGWGQEEDRRRSREAGIDYHLVKPLATRDLEEILAAVPRRPQAQRGRE